MEFTHHQDGRAFRIRQDSMSGYTLFTSPDLPGLNVSSIDPKKARERLRKEISRLVKIEQKGSRHGA